jgi:hypothetical protein
MKIETTLPPVVDGKIQLEDNTSYQLKEVAYIPDGVTLIGPQGTRYLFGDSGLINLTSKLPFDMSTAKRTSLYSWISKQ